MADRAFEVPRLAELYDVLDPDRSDLEVYAALAHELGARTVLDIGCGTGTFAVMLAAAGVRVVGLDPAEASLDVARRKPGADLVTWIQADVSALPDLAVDLVTMTANVAQVFVTDLEWAQVLQASWRALRPGGYLVVESRVPAARAWERWTREHTYQRTEVAGVGGVETWIDLIEVTATTVSFRGTCVFSQDGAVLTSDSTLRFRDRDEITGSLRAAGFSAPEVRDAPDRPGLEHVFIAKRPAVG
jgi:ubiquinone/menaquinone biosynthesis C-methylase UbiE